MAKQTIQTKTVVKTRSKKNGSTNSSGYRQCNICHGTGVVQSGKKSAAKAKGKKR